MYMYDIVVTTTVADSLRETHTKFLLITSRLITTGTWMINNYTHVRVTFMYITAGKLYVRVYFNVLDRTTAVEFRELEYNDVWYS